jgi:hypothetical protein
MRRRVQRGELQRRLQAPVRQHALELAERESLAAQKLRQYTDPEPRGRARMHQCRVVDLQRGPQVQLLGLRAAPQLQRRWRVGLQRPEHRVRAELGGQPRPTMGGEIGRSRAQDLRRVAERRAQQRRALVHAIADPQVPARRRRLGQRVGQSDLQLDVGIMLEEARHQRAHQQPAIASVHEHLQALRAAGRGEARAHRRDLAQQSLAVRLQQGAGGGEGYAPGGPLQQAAAEAPLEAGDGAADGDLGYLQLARRGREGAQLGDVGERGHFRRQPHIVS